MARHKDFLAQLDNFRHEAYVASQYLYSDMAVQHAASKSKKLLHRLNRTPTFWLTHSAASQSACYLCLARVFDRSSAYNVDALLRSFESNLHLFSRESLLARKQEGRQDTPEWLERYLKRAHYPTVRDVEQLRKKVADYRTIYLRAIEPARHKYIAHRVRTEHDEVQALFGGGKVRELWRMVTFLYALYEALWQQYHNGRKPVLRPLRYSVKAIYDAPLQRSEPHERIIAETKQLMRFLETAAPSTALD